MTAADRSQLRTRAVRHVALLAGAGTVLVVVGGVLLAIGDRHGPAGGALGVGIAFLAVAAATAAKRLLPPPDQVEERHAPGSPACVECAHEGMSPRRRRFIAGGAAATASAVFGGVLLRDSGAEEALQSTPWQRGDALVTRDGRMIRVGDLSPGALVTVWPDHAIGVADAQVALLRLHPRNLGEESRHQEWAPEGHVAYSKLCTHMGCPVGLFQTDPHVLICPCHQAVFDVFDGARAVQGPARRPLPQLPLMIGDDGVLRAQAGFTDKVGPGWWGRPG